MPLHVLSDRAGSLPEAALRSQLVAKSRLRRALALFLGIKHEVDTDPRPGRFPSPDRRGCAHWDQIHLPGSFQPSLVTMPEG